MTQTCIDLKFNLEIGKCNGSMSVGIYNNEQQLSFLENIIEHNLIFDYNITLPNKIKFVLADKNPKFDTKIDSSGNIIEDKYIQLIDMSRGGIPIKPVTLFKICRYTVKDKINFDTYWGFDGSAEIDFNEDTFIKWHLKLDNLFDL